MNSEQLSVNNERLIMSDNRLSKTEDGRPMFDE